MTKKELLDRYTDYEGNLDIESQKGVTISLIRLQTEAIMESDRTARKLKEQADTIHFNNCRDILWDAFQMGYAKCLQDNNIK